VDLKVIGSMRRQPAIMIEAGRGAGTCGNGINPRTRKEKERCMPQRRPRPMLRYESEGRELGMLRSITNLPRFCREGKSRIAGQAARSLWSEPDAVID
jgi:hypothetical protein